MENKLRERAKAFVRAHRKQNIWYRLMCVLASLVVFITTYMLILPAITMERETYCGIEDHTHTESCYQAPAEIQMDFAEVLSVSSYDQSFVFPEDELIVEPEGDVYDAGTSVSGTSGSGAELTIEGIEIIEDAGSDPQPELPADTEPAEPEAESETGTEPERETETETESVTESAMETEPAAESITEASSEPETGEGMTEESTEEEYEIEILMLEEETLEEPVELLAEEGTLPVTEPSGAKAEYDKITDLFTTNVRIDFTFTNSSAQANVSYIYTYPEGIVIPDTEIQAGAQDLYDGETLAGKYKFLKNEDGTYSVEVTFNKEYIEQAGSTVTGFVQFTGSFGKEDMDDKGNIVVGTDDATVLVPSSAITYPADSTETYDIDVSKSGMWVQDGDKLVYTVYVRTTKGTPDPINLSDIITVPEGLTLGEPVVSIEKGTANYYYADWEQTWKPTDNNDWSEVSSITPSYDSGNLTISLSKLSAMKTKDSNNNECIVGDVYKIIYTYPITDQTIESVSVNNSVTVEASDNGRGQTVSDGAESSVNISKDFNYKIDKSGCIASDKPGYIKWTVTVNSNNQNIAGAVLTDTMLGQIDQADEITVEPNTGAAVNKADDGTITSVTFSATEDNKNKNTYTVTYYTPITESWDGSAVTNTATLDPTPDETGDEKTVSATVTVSGMQMNKTGTYNGTTNKIDWIITVNSGRLDIAGATLTDEMFALLTEQNFTVEPSSGIQFTKNSDGKNTGITFVAVEDTRNT
ncbi:MAG: collagen binding domain-containing protein [Candidatus Choladocola sp.]|nr:collagen binding domain-containing protein [Candidatus Choladocola sp.]